MTKFERFKKISVEEMAYEIEKLSNYICGRYDCSECPFEVSVNCGCNVVEITNWLNSEAEE